MILDTNIVILMLDPDGPPMLKEHVAQLRHRGALTINEIVFAELSSGYDSVAEQQAMLAQLDLQLERMTLEACYRAGTAFAEYRRRGGRKERMLPDFLVGAHAACGKRSLVTCDRRGFGDYFPELDIINPMDIDS